MHETDRAILEIFAGQVRHAYPSARIFAFGSRSRGDATWESDFDVCVVLDEKSGDDEQSLLRIAWEVGFENERVFNLLVFWRKEFEEGPLSDSTLLHNIQKEGIPA